MILSTKLHIPQLRGDILVERPTITELLNKGLKTKLTSVTAPGGYGKTTALSHWLKQSGIPSVWVSFDPQDNDLIQFWSYVIAAVDSKNSGFAEAMNTYLPTLKSGAFATFITAMIDEFSSHSDELVLIFDDYHSIHLSSIHASVVFLLEHLPAHIHLYIASRFELPIPTARLQTMGQVVKITIRDLRFQLDEGIRYFRDCMGFSLSKDDVSILVSRTEGWISGLHLAAISLKKSDHSSNFINAFSGVHRSVADYLFQEVFSHQSDEMRSFLLETSILNRMNDALCEAVTGQTNCQERLELLDQQNLFIIPLDDERQWYRYHHLFSEFLQRQYQQKHPEQAKQLYVRAANWLEEHGFFEEAVEHFLMGGHYPEVVSLIGKHLHGLQLKRGVLYRWFSALPESSLLATPEVQLLYVKILAESEGLELAGSRLRLMEDNLSDPEWKPFVGTFFYLYAAVSFYRKEFQRATEYLELFEQHMPEGSYIQMIEANTFTVNFDSLLVFFDDLHEAEKFFYKWIKVWENKKNYPYVGFFYVAYSELLYEWNRLEEAEVYLERALREKCMQPYFLIFGRAAIYAARVSLAKGNSAKAFDLLEQIKPNIDSPDRAIALKKLDAEKAYLSLANGSFKDVTAWLGICGLKHSDTVPLYLFSEYLQLARALMQCGSVNEALQLLEHLHRLVDNEDRLRYKIKVCILQSIALHRKGDTTDALMKLESVLHLAQPQGYIRSFVDEGVELANLLAQYLDHRQHSSLRNSLPVPLRYVKKLLQLMNGQTEGSLPLPSLLTQQEMKILRMIEQGFKNQQIADNIYVTVGTVKTHLKNIYRKLEVNSRLQALQRAKELNLL
ncbi:LuxR C-terminal-related transcriptional regulator [Aneurinibacillus sp. Ricciae_BoGa-3]|uniref:LuxR C-terminal-related transcriptional regulator n=1 Tax=Aneurinibacillus sp. Ricciae_BoGa-3 TaxID=3022697 RepID=UPI0023407A73|nr:LuxR C-terminal-related transcriptional regulator [Aneurinibacillus sp. Ricciae_BoGa-3]WCK54261.1 LuxR C-terminal-related transcriptional regulator [Aneurinibacillus sp. Ricciae_BoGa-3]